MVLTPYEQGIREVKKNTIRYVIKTFHTVWYLVFPGEATASTGELPAAGLRRQDSREDNARQKNDNKAEGHEARGTSLKMCSHISSPFAQHDTSNCKGGAIVRKKGLADTIILIS